LTRVKSNFLTKGVIFSEIYNLVTDINAPGRGYIYVWSSAKGHLIFSPLAMLVTP